MSAIEKCIQFFEQGFPYVPHTDTAAAARAEYEELKRKAEAWEEAGTLWEKAEKSKYHETFVEWFHARFSELHTRKATP